MKSVKKESALTNLKEQLLTMAVFTGIFLPVRLFFYSVVSTWWIGSFGLMTAILVLLMYYSKKGKLGAVGHIINRQMAKYAKGKLGIFSMIYLVLWIYLFSNAILGMEFADQQVKDRFIIELEAQGISNLDDTLEASENIRFVGPDTWIGPVYSIFITITPHPIGWVMYSIINDWSDGWLLHFVTVFMIEEIEILGLIIYFRYKKNEEN